jgi:hypothetical protein
LHGADPTGRHAELERTLTARMMAAAEAEQFEAAARLRDQLSTVHQLQEKQRIATAEQDDDADVFGYHFEAGALAVNLFHIRNGKIVDRREFFWEDLPTLIENFTPEESELQDPQRMGAPGPSHLGTWDPTKPPSPPRPPKTREEALALCSQQILDLVASFQHAVVGDLLKKTFAAAEAIGARRILVTGGVAANRELRERFTAEASRRSLRVAFPTLALSTDNAAMIAAAAWPRFLAGEFASPSLSADPSLALGG